MKKFFKNLEFKIFTILLKRYCNHELDQWSLYKVKSNHGEIYVSISRQPNHEGTEKTYNLI